MAVIAELIDKTPEFMHFYRLAQGADPEQRWELWKQHYGRAMVPPGPDGMAMARRLLDASWDRYPEVMDRIERGAAGMEPAPQQVLDRVAGLLGCDVDLTVKVQVITANLEGNAYAFKHEGVSWVVIPVEQAPEDRGPVLAHEFAHAVHMALSGCTDGYPTTIALRAMLEGIAIHTAMQAWPGLPETGYLEMLEDAGWLARCREHDQAILKAVLEHLPADDMETYHRFILGPGPGAGLPREVYYGGYRVVGHLLAKGQTLASLARVRSEQLTDLLGATLRELI